MIRSAGLPKNTGGDDIAEGMLPENREHDAHAQDAANLCPVHLITIENAYVSYRWVYVIGTIWCS